MKPMMKGTTKIKDATPKGLRHAEKMAGIILSATMLMLVIAPAYGFNEPGPELLPPPMPETMPPLPTGQQPVDEPLPQNPHGDGVTAKDVERVAALFKENGMSLENLRITRLISLRKNSPHLRVEVQLHDHNVPVLDSYHVFDFTDGKLDDPASREAVKEKVKTLAGIGNKRKPTVTRWQVIEGYRQYVRLDPLAKNEAEKEVAARLVLNNTADRGMPEKYGLAWEVSLAPGGPPYATIDATSGKMLRYDNGIRH
jgi:hypothetical protein